MNCEEYRQAIGADPSFDGGAVHLSECASCQAYRKEMLQLDKAINAALSIDVPELNMPELPDLDTSNIVPLSSRRWAPPTLLAMAATVLLAAFVGLRMFGSAGDYDTLGEELLAHLDHEPYALRVTNVPVPDDRLTSVVPADMAQLDHSAGLITYAQTCRINGRDVPHLDRLVPALSRHAHRRLEHPNSPLVLALISWRGGRGHRASVEHELTRKRIAVSIWPRARCETDPNDRAEAQQNRGNDGAQPSGGGGGGGRSEPPTAPAIASDVSSRIDWRMSTPVAASICSDRDTTAAGSWLMNPGIPPWP